MWSIAPTALAINKTWTTSNSKVLENLHIAINPAVRQSQKTTADDVHDDGPEIAIVDVDAVEVAFRHARELDEVIELAELEQLQRLLLEEKDVKGKGHLDLPAHQAGHGVLHFCCVCSALLDGRTELLHGIEHRVSLLTASMDGHADITDTKLSEFIL
jgi:hypothetical protein